ncbi:MAG: glyoxalase [Solirubrobacterales bacterium]|jgi:catechol 2,3-dioxygenase-like lactoylglutathione lyase family enzyme|nr:glyoxalase [Solirubrobacterales bacterium]
MEPRISLVTLGVDDLPRARGFYEALGWRGQAVQDTVFFQAGGLALVLWSRELLAADSGLEAAPAPHGFDGVVLAQNVRYPAEVDALLAAAKDAGATVTKPAGKTFYGGYAGTFLDPDGHAWEIAWNPGFTLAEDGTLVLPDFGA